MEGGREAKNNNDPSPLVPGKHTFFCCFSPSFSFLPLARLFFGPSNSLAETHKPMDGAGVPNEPLPFPPPFVRFFEGGFLLSFASFFLPLVDRSGRGGDPLSLLDEGGGRLARHRLLGGLLLLLRRLGVGGRLQKFLRSRGGNNLQIRPYPEAKTNSRTNQRRWRRILVANDSREPPPEFRNCYPSLEQLSVALILVLT